MLALIRWWMLPLWGVSHPGRHCPHRASLVGEHPVLSRRFSRLHLVHLLQGATSLSELNVPSAHGTQTPSPPSPNPQSWEGCTVGDSESEREKGNSLVLQPRCCVMCYLWELLSRPTCRADNTCAIRVKELCLITALLTLHLHTLNLREYTFKMISGKILHTKITCSWYLTWNIKSKSCLV